MLVAAHFCTLAQCTRTTGTPGAEPYGDSLSDTDNVERNMKLRYVHVQPNFILFKSNSMCLRFKIKG